MPNALENALSFRAAVLATVRAFFATRGYLEVETPVLVQSPGLDVHLDAFAVTTPQGRHAGYLNTSPEYQMKRLLAAGLHRTFQFARCFRAGELGRRHNPEFTMLEWYRAHASYEDLMIETEELVRAVAAAHRGGSLWVGRDIDVSEPFLRMTVGEAFERFAATSFETMLALASLDEDQYFRLLVDHVEPGLASLERPVFLSEFPSSQASLARRKESDPRVCERFELYVGDVELCNAFGELCDPVEQRARLVADQQAREKRGKPVLPIDERFLSALEAGMPAASGNALGLDRLIACVAGAEDIGEVMAFPWSQL